MKPLSQASKESDVWSITAAAALAMYQGVGEVRMNLRKAVKAACSDLTYSIISETPPTTVELVYIGHHADDFIFRTVNEAVYSQVHFGINIEVAEALS